MSSLLQQAKIFEQKSKEQASNTETALNDAFSKHEKSVLEALSASGKIIKDAIDAQTTSLNTAVESYEKIARSMVMRTWRFVLVTFFLVFGIGGSVVWYTGHLIRSNAEEIQQQNQTLDALAKKGGKIQMTNCGSAGRLCVKVDSSAGAYGTNSEYMIVAGY
ncbi:MbeB family mobilization protein [Salmonella enterica subsp. enterica serovar Poona]|nr:MbeB family mobilization protein [Salmonella enterica subsp. enterica serovar Poona]